LIEEVKARRFRLFFFIDEPHHDEPVAGRSERFGQPAKTGAGTREIAYHRGTTWSEYKKIFQKDPALATVPGCEGREPTETQCNGHDARHCRIAEKHHKFVFSMRPWGGK